MSEYIATPIATAAPFEPVVVALAAATTKTVLQVAPPSGTDITILGWGVSFDAAAAGQPGWVQLISTDVAASAGTSLTPGLWGNSQQQASLCVGGAALTAHTMTTEGVITGTPVPLDQQEVYPQSGYGVWFVPDRRPRVAPSKFLRVRCKMPAAVNCIPWIVWTEPAI